MKKILTRVLTLATAGVLLSYVPRVSAQDDAPPPPPPPAAPAAEAAGGPGRGGPGGDWQQRRAEMLKTALKASDDEWTVIQPLLEKVETTGRVVMAARFGGMGGGPGGGRGPRRAEDANGANGANAGGGGNRRERADNGGGGNRPDRPQGRGPTPEVQALNDSLKNDGASVDEIKAKLAAVRQQRKKANADFEQAREDLKKVLNMRQEATLVAMGVLD